ncbi:hypothetical protein PG993_009112 [Apiospora rasikravindrae]|uniref:Uncharacterized protein n=1 Tax=Apiospora rasikravindrae TaxID=990691 RepID=A0ABR1SIY2_9PEZI
MAQYCATPHLDEHCQFKTCNGSPTTNPSIVLSDHDGDDGDGYRYGERDGYHEGFQDGWQARGRDGDDRGYDTDADRSGSEFDEGNSYYSVDDSIKTENFDWAEQFQQPPIHEQPRGERIDRHQLVLDWTAHRQRIRAELRDLRDNDRNRLYHDGDIDQQIPDAGNQNYVAANPQDDSFGQAAFVTYFPVAADDNDHDQDFESRTIPVKQLLDQGHEFFPRSRKARERKSLVWTHIPVNNLEWVYRLMIQIYLKQGNSRDEAEQKSFRTLRLGILAGRRAVGQSTPFHQLGLQSSCHTIKVSEEGERTRDDTLSIFMPYVHWETSIAREHTGRIIESSTTATPDDIDHLPCGVQEKLLRYHIPSNPSFHHRRTLDQFHYPMLNSLEARDRDQVVENTWSEEALSTETPRNDIFPSIFRYVKDSHKRGWIKKSGHLTCCIVDRCASNVFDPHLFIDEKLNFMGPRNRGIVRFSNQLPQMDRQSALFGSITGTDNTRQRNTTTVADANQEFKILIDIKDVLDELDILRSIQKEQEGVLEHYQVPYLRDSPIAEYYLKRKPKEREDILTDLVKKATSAHEHLLQFIDMQQKQTNLAQLRSSEAVLASMRDILESSNRVQNSSRAILESNKQMMKQSEESGEILMTFTVVTIIFLPISTLASMFSLNAQELNDGKLSIGVVFAYIGERISDPWPSKSSSD